MSRIKDLIKRLEVIPEKEKKATQLDEMVAVLDKLRDSIVAAESLKNAASALKQIEGADFADKASQGLEGAGASARRLHARLQAGAGFERKRADEALTAINEKLAHGSTGVMKGWRSLIEDQSRRYRPLADAAKSASLPGAEGLQAAIIDLTDWRDAPPETVASAERYKATASSIPTAIADLGLQGPAGDFMVAAAKGNAKAKDLQKPEVIAFLDANAAIWAMLKVGL